MSENYESLSLVPIVCKYCKDYVTFIEFDIDLHFCDEHDIRYNSQIKDLINEGKKLGAKSSQDSIQQLELEFFKRRDEPTSDVKKEDVIEGHNIRKTLPILRRLFQ